MSRKTSPERAAHIQAINQQIGARVKELRLVRGFSQEQLAEAVGLTFQQIQKYEKGTNRISAGTLCEVARVIGVNLSDIFGNLSTSILASGGKEEVSRPRFAMELVRAIDDLGDDRMANTILSLVRQIVVARRDGVRGAGVDQIIIDDPHAPGVAQ